MTTSRVLVTGINGFIGTRLRARLKRRGITILGGGIDQKNALDVTDREDLESLKDIDAIVHLAAKSSVKYSFQEPFETYRTNLLGTLNVLELARIRNVHDFIFVSTYVYGQPTYLPVDEKHPINAYSPYHQSKLIGEQLCKNYSTDFGINVTTLRTFYVYGPNSKSYHFIPSVIMQIKKNGKVVLSGERTKRDFLFVDDFVDLLENVLERFPQGYSIYNVGYGRSYYLNEVSQLLAKLLDKKITIHYDEKMRPNDVNEMVADISKVSNEFKWRPSTSLEKGLKMCV